MHLSSYSSSSSRFYLFKIYIEQLTIIINKHKFAQLLHLFFIKFLFSINQLLELFKERFCLKKPRCQMFFNPFRKTMSRKMQLKKLAERHSISIVFFCFIS